MDKTSLDGKWSAGNGPIIAEVANKMGIAGADDDAKATQLRSDVRAMNITQMNEFITEFTNKVLLQMVYKRMEFKDPFFKKFFTIPSNPSAVTEIIDSKLLKANRFTFEKRFPDKQTRANNLRKQITTIVRDYITNTVSMAGIRASFSTEQAFSSWVALQTDLLQQSLQVELYNNVTQDAVVADVKNVFYAGEIKEWDKRFAVMLGVATLMGYPTKEWNLGFDNPLDPNNELKTKVQVNSMNDLVVIGNPNFMTAINTTVDAVKFHNQYFKVSSFNDFVGANKMDMNSVIIIDKDAPKGYFRVNQTASNYWAGNMTIETFLHYWITYGTVPWANGVKIIFSAPVGTDHHAQVSTDLKAITDVMYIKTKAVTTTRSAEFTDTKIVDDQSDETDKTK